MTRELSTAPLAGRRRWLCVSALAASCLAFSACASSTTPPQEVEAPPAGAVENKQLGDVWLDLTNGTNDSITINMTTNCDDNDSQALQPGQMWRGTGSCNRKAAVEGQWDHKGKQFLYVEYSTLTFTGGYTTCQWSVDTDNNRVSPTAKKKLAGKDSNSYRSDSEGTCNELLSVSGDHPSSDPRFHWRATILR